MDYFSAFVSLAEVTIAFVATRTSGPAQIVLIVFSIFFPLPVADAFFALLWFRPYVFYSPGEYGSVDVEKYVGALAQARYGKTIKQTADLGDSITAVGNPDLFQLLFKVSGSGWKKSTKAMEIAGGCVVQVTTELLNADGSFSAAEAITFVPGVGIENDSAGSGRHLSPLKKQP